MIFLWSKYVRGPYKNTYNFIKSLTVLFCSLKYIFYCRVFDYGWLLVLMGSARIVGVVASTAAYAANCF